MRISIVTVCYNAADTIADTIESVAEQTHPDVEHIVVDGASTDGTQDVARRHGRRVAHFVSEPDRGIYDAMNKGLRLSSGEVIAFLNADDVYVSPDVLARVADVLQDDALDACHADLVYVDRHDTSRVVRVWTSRAFSPGLFRRGWMPAHPTLFVRRRVYQAVGEFDLQFSLQADFDLTMRMFEFSGVKSRYVPQTWVRMRAGGASNNSIRNVIRGNLEAWRACRKNGLRVPPWFVVTKVLSRLPQFRWRQG